MYIRNYSARLYPRHSSVDLSCSLVFFSTCYLPAPPCSWSSRPTRPGTQVDYFNRRYGRDSKCRYPPRQTFPHWYSDLRSYCPLASTRRLQMSRGSLAAWAGSLRTSRDRWGRCSARWRRSLARSPTLAGTVPSERTLEDLLWLKFAVGPNLASCDRSVLL